MMIPAPRSLVSAALILGVAAAAGCAKQQADATPPSEEKTFALTPGRVPVRFGFLAGELKDLKIIERVEHGTDKVTDPPRLRGTFTLKNTSADQTARLVAARIEYLDRAGHPIVPTRSDTAVPFSSYQSDRLDPGAETSRDVDVPFPRAALKSMDLSDVRVNLVYLPGAYRTESANAAVSIGK